LARDQDEFEVECSGHVLKRGETRINLRSLEVGDLALVQSEPGGHFLLAESLDGARFAEDA